MNYTVLGINSGMGVSLFPFKSQVIANVECRSIFHTPGNTQWKINFGDIPLYKTLQPDFGNVDVLISSPDCGSGSILRMSRAKTYGDHRQNKSLAMFFEAITTYRPKFFEFENLEGLFKSFSEADFNEILSNYRLIKHIAPVSMWGNSQIYRKRLIVVGIRRDLSEKIDKFFRLPDYRDRNKTCGELYGDLCDLDYKVAGFNPRYPDKNFRPHLESMIKLGHVREDLRDLCTIYAGRKLPIWEIQEYWQNDFKNLKRWVVTDRNFNRAPGVYRNRLKDYPATARKANRQFDHNGLMLTPRQLARIQGIPDEFVIYLEENKLNYWINKGRALVTKTPPFEISNWLKRKLDKTLNLKLWQ